MDETTGRTGLVIANGQMVTADFTTNRTITLDGGTATIEVLNTTSPGWSVSPTPDGYPLAPHVNTFTVASPIGQIGTGALNKDGPGTSGTHGGQHLYRDHDRSTRARCWSVAAAESGT